MSLKKLMGMLVIVLMLMLVLTALWKIYRDDQQCVTAATSLPGQWWVELQVCVCVRALGGMTAGVRQQHDKSKWCGTCSV